MIQTVCPIHSTSCPKKGIFDNQEDLKSHLVESGMREEDFIIQTQGNLKSDKVIENDIMTASAPPVFTSPPPRIVPSSTGSEPVYSKTELPPEAIARVQAKEETPVTPKPLVLTYKFDGECPTCRTPATTIMVSGDKFAIAFCMECNKQIGEVEVPPLNQPKKDIESKKKEMKPS